MATAKRPPPDPWDLEAKRLIKSAMALKGYSFKALAAALGRSGYPISAPALALRVNRASFNMGFALHTLRAMGIDAVDLSHIKLENVAQRLSRRSDVSAEDVD